MKSADLFNAMQSGTPIDISAVTRSKCPKGRVYVVAMEVESGIHNVYCWNVRCRPHRGESFTVFVRCER